jgi:hypothetical protein
MLVTDVQLQLQGSAVLLTLQDKGKAPQQVQSCQLNLQHSLLHGLIHLLQQALAKAEWQSAAVPEVLPGKPEELRPTTGYQH